MFCLWARGGGATNVCLALLLIELMMICNYFVLLSIFPG